MDKIPINEANGWLLSLCDRATDIYVYYCHIGSWAGVFHRKIQDDTELVLIRQNNIRHDSLWFSFLLFSFVSFWIIHSTVSKSILFMIFSVSLYRVTDLGVHGVRLILFGWNISSVKQERMLYVRIQRRITHLMMHVTELVFYYAIIYFVCCQVGMMRFFSPQGDSIDASQALIVSWSTITTIGYGNYAPSNEIATFACMAESATGILWLTGIISQLIGRTPIDNREDGSLPNAITHGVNFEGRFLCKSEYINRCYIPPIYTFLFTSIAVFLMGIFSLDIRSSFIGLLYLLLAIATLAYSTFLFNLMATLISDAEKRKNRSDDF